MKSIWAWAFWGVFVFFSVFLTTGSNSTIETTKIISHSSAEYTAESSIEQMVYEIEWYQKDKINHLNSVIVDWSQKDMNYWVLNRWASTWYFDLKVKNSTDFYIDLWKNVWGVLQFKWVQNEDDFNTFVLNFNKDWENEDVLIEVIRREKSWSFQRCDILEDCWYVDKVVIHTGDESMDGWVEKWYQFYFQWWSHWYSSQAEIRGFNPLVYDYTISFITLTWKKISYEYSISKSWNLKSVVNNFIQIESTGNAIDSYQKVVLEKRITKDLKPLAKYVLFSNTDIEK